MSIIDSFPSKRIIIMTLPPFLRKPTIIALLSVGYTGLTYVHGQFSSYVASNRSILNFRATRGGLERRLNQLYPNGRSGTNQTQAFVVEEQSVRTFISLGLDSEGGPSISNWMDNEPGDKPTNWLDSEMTDSATLTVKVPYSYRNSQAAIRATLKWHLTASIQFTFQVLT